MGVGAERVNAQGHRLHPNSLIKTVFQPARGHSGALRQREVEATGGCAMGNETIQGKVAEPLDPGHFDP